MLRHKRYLKINDPLTYTMIWRKRYYDKDILEFYFTTTWATKRRWKPTTCTTLSRKSQ